MCFFTIDLFTRRNVNIIWTVYNFWNIYISLKRVPREGFYNRHLGSKAWTIKQCLYFKQRADGFPMCFFIDLKRQGISDYLSIACFLCYIRADNAHVLWRRFLYVSDRFWVFWKPRIHEASLQYNGGSVLSLLPTSFLV